MGRITGAAIAQGRGLAVRAARCGSLAFLAIFAFFLAVRWPFRAEYLVNWDSVQFALGVGEFNLEAHQPHPPGYVGYIAFARLLSALVGDVPAALTLISVVSGALAPAAFFLFARRLLDLRHAMVATLLFGLSPLLWYYSDVALTYAPEVALALVFVWAAHRAATEGRTGDLLIATVLLALLGAVRQSAMLLVAGVWVYALFAFGWRTRVMNAALLGAVVSLWALPLLWLAGGLEAYLRESAALAELVGTRTSIFSAPVAGVAQNAGMVLAGAIVGMHVTALLGIFAHVRYGNPWMLLQRGDRRLLLAWGGPSLAVFLLGHTGQPGYVLLVLPVAFVWLGAAIALIDRAHSAPGRAQTRARWATVMPLSRLLPALLVASITAHVLFPRLVYSFATSDLAATAQRGLDVPSPAARSSGSIEILPEQSPLATAMRQYSIGDNDRYWRDVIEYIELFDPNEVIVLASIGGPMISGSFRHVGYYLPDYAVHGVGWDRDGRFGDLFQSRDGESTYSIASLRAARPQIDVPANVRWIVMPDGDLASQLDESLRRYRVKLESGAMITVVPVNRERMLVFTTISDEDARIFVP